MSIKPLAAAAAFLLGGCVYTETPYGRMAVVDLPVRSETHQQKRYRQCAAGHDRHLSRQCARRLPAPVSLPLLRLLISDGLCDEKHGYVFKIRFKAKGRLKAEAAKRY